jgi:hypothetical protein
MRRDKAQLSYTLYGARDNLVVEFLVDRFKTAGQSRVLATDGLDELELLMLGRVAYDNRSRRHSRLDYRIPLAVLRQMRLYNSQNSVDWPVDSFDSLQSDHPP